MPVSVQQPLRIVLLGCGAVGGGVYRRLAALPDRFTVLGVVARDLEKARAQGIPARLLTRDAAALLARACDVVVELIGGRQSAQEWISAALRAGRDVVTANKALLAAEGGVLQALADRSGGRLRFSAAVGGALPALEAVHRAPTGEILHLRGVLNGTSNFIIERLAAGEDFPAALAAARLAGLAEADPTLDLDGSDAAQKLALLVQAAGRVLPWTDIPREGITGQTPALITAAAKQGGTVRLLAEAEFTAMGVRANVRPQRLGPDDPLAACPGAWNALEISYRDGRREILRGCGAGRWPTTEAVLADLHDLRAERAQIHSSELEAAS